MTSSRRRSKRTTDGGFWVSYSDLATSLMLVFVLIVCITNLKTQKQLSVKQDKLLVVESEVRDLLSRREEISTRLLRAVTEANEKIGSPVFQYANGEVFVSESVVAWFESGGATLTKQGKEQVGVFYKALYASLLGDGTVLPDFLAAIDIEGHTDPWPISGSGTLWSWASYNGTAQFRHRDGNLWLSQRRGKAILDHIQDLYDDNKIDEQRYPWRAFAAVARVTGRSWTRAYCPTASGELQPLTADMLLKPNPCPETPRDPQAALNRASRRVTFGFDLDDKVILEHLQQVLHEASLAKKAP